LIYPFYGKTAFEEKAYQENSIIISRYQVILIFDKVLFKKPPPQGSETILQGIRRFFTGFMAAWPSFPSYALFY